MKKRRTCITLRAKQNHAFLEVAQGSSLSGTTLPNGYTVPKAPKDYEWIARRRSVYLERQVGKPTTVKGYTQRSPAGYGNY